MTRIDPATGQPSGGPVPVGSGPAGIAVTPAAVWVANSLDLTVSRINPATSRVSRHHRRRRRAERGSSRPTGRRVGER